MKKHFKAAAFGLLILAVIFGAVSSVNSSTCTGTIKLLNCGTKYATFAYTWTWDQCPAITKSDSAAMQWLAYDAEGKNIDVIRTDLQTAIYYYDGSKKVFTRSVEEEPSLSFNTVDLRFDVNEPYISSMGLPRQAFAKYGVVQVRVQVDDSVDNNINYIVVSGLYGHATLTSVDIIAETEAKIGAGSKLLSRSDRQRFEAGWDQEKHAGKGSPSVNLTKNPASFVNPANHLPSFVSLTENF